MVISILFTAFRLVSNAFLRGKLRSYDYIIIAATLIAIGQSIATSMMVTFGLGQHMDKLSDSNLKSYEQSSLAASILYIVALSASKLSLFVFLNEMLVSVPMGRRLIFPRDSMCYCLRRVLTLYPLLLGPLASQVPQIHLHRLGHHGLLYGTHY